MLRLPTFDWYIVEEIELMDTFLLAPLIELFLLLKALCLLLRSPLLLFFHVFFLDLVTKMASFCIEKLANSFGSIYALTPFTYLAIFLVESLVQVSLSHIRAFSGTRLVLRLCDVLSRAFGMLGLRMGIRSAAPLLLHSLQLLVLHAFSSEIRLVVQLVGRRVVRHSDAWVGVAGS